MKQSKLMCWEITGCGHQDGCNVFKLAQAGDKSCWEVVGGFDDYRSALNVCGDCVVSVLTRQHSLSVDEIKDIMQNKAGCPSHNTCPGLLPS
ncbi:MAG: hypothetical protein ABFS18_07075 [Thermodesulfobacteriota bacterium]